VCGSKIMSIRELSEEIKKEMSVWEYGILCILLGNDFVPHMCGVNIRKGGIEKIKKAYKEKGVKIIKNGEIDWKELKKIIEWMDKEKCNNIEKKEMRMERNGDKETIFNNAPLFYKEEENYINPLEKNWEKRYYKCLFEKTDSIEEICNNYFEAIEWIFRYYTDKCYDWNWKYNYDYPPLLGDLAKTKTKSNYFPNCIYNPVDAKTQLDFVLPNGKNVKDLKFKWAFCRYSWEGHVVFPKDH